MKKYLLVVVALFIIGTSSVNAQAVWGARVGLSRPTMTFTESGESGNLIDGVFGLEIGPVMYYSLKNNFYLNTGAMFSIKSFKDSADYKINAYYAEVPVYAGYGFHIGKAALYAQAGPYIGVKIAENDKIEGKTSTDNPLFSTLNAGLGVMAGVNIKRFKIELGYQWGLANVLNEAFIDDKSDAKLKLNSIFLGISCVF
jgi:hypothetical protein